MKNEQVTMNECTKNMSAEEIIKYIARDYIELSHDKVWEQRNHYITICREWLKQQNKDQE